LRTSVQQLAAGFQRRRLIHRLADIDQQLCGPAGFWLFILGVNNSGTTLLTNLLKAHPEICALPAEGQLLTESLPRPDRLGVVRIWTRRMDVFRWTEENDPTPALQAKLDWLGHLPCAPGIILEKSPPNTLRSRWLQAFFRPSRFIAMIRSPFAVCEGMRRRQGYGLEASAAHWATANRCLLDDLTHLERKMFLTYEDVVANPLSQLDSIRHFLGLQAEFPKGLLESIGAHSAAGRTAGLTDLNAESDRRLSPTERKAIANVTGEVARRLGYV
jgi:hypothetical protein